MHNILKLILNVTIPYFLQMLTTQKNDLNIILFSISLFCLSFSEDICLNHSMLKFLNKGNCIESRLVVLLLWKYVGQLCEQSYVIHDVQLYPCLQHYFYFEVLFIKKRFIGGYSTWVSDSSCFLKDNFWHIK